MATSARPSVESMNMLGARIAELREHHPSGVFLLVVREAVVGGIQGDPLPDRARQRGRELLKELGPSVLGIAYVYEGEGFGASIVRMTFRGLVFMSPVPTVVSAAVEDGVAWVCASPSLPDEFTEMATSLIAVVERLRGKLHLASSLDSQFPRPAC